MTADDLGVGGALTVLMKDAIMPTLMQVWGGGGGGGGCKRTTEERPQVGALDYRNAPRRIPALCTALCGVYI